MATFRPAICTLHVGQRDVVNEGIPLKILTRIFREDGPKPGYIVTVRLAFFCGGVGPLEPVGAGTLDQ